MLSPFLLCAGLEHFARSQRFDRRCSAARRATPHWADLPVIALTADAMVRDMERA